jgi:hypothetical protein
MWPARRLAPFRRSRANGCVCSVRAVLSCSPACPIPARPATTRSRPPVRHFAAVALSGPPRPAGSVAEISFFTTYPVGDGIAPVERLSADRHVTRGGPVRLACQRSNVRLQRPNSPASSSGVMYSERIVPARSNAAGTGTVAAVFLCGVTFVAPQGTYRDAFYIIERSGQRLQFVYRLGDIIRRIMSASAGQRN